MENLTGQRHDRVQTESQIATMDSCFDLVGSLQHGVASCEVFSWSTDIHKTHYMQMVMTSDETQIQIFANWPISHAKRVTRDNRKNPEYRVVAGQFVSFRSFLIAATTRYSGFFLLSLTMSLTSI